MPMQVYTKRQLDEVASLISERLSIPKYATEEAASKFGLTLEDLREAAHTPPSRDYCQVRPETETESQDTDGGC
ncbi:hypothetical protein KR51_00006570 [Rubidibacter lacunae KORDI 51-2]|uniref:Uncharacterized protein n=1 Tax=Rubidibacter lacunae KORDI 51-2 TaxID=582515 RepID=U5DPV7_9CHRO|nr:hypothetical protein KR51_00006570 [Rubidibacter lacunae KORDI 51-2]